MSLRRQAVWLQQRTLSVGFRPCARSAWNDDSFRKRNPKPAILQQGDDGGAKKNRLGFSWHCRVKRESP